ncbi:MAG: Stp1/IreP family PP2C-type Ser/Thr phosphatase [Rhodocyclales bacterium]|nr:Stp1/IreP family PP2C-type Ser/Thr phosphatase [Rhodocyclales bacterium]
MDLSLPVALEIATRSDPGRVRTHNEDSVFVNPALGLVLLADGMGGYNAGEVASGMATTLLASGLATAFAERGPGEREVDGRRSWARTAMGREIASTNEVIHAAAVNQPAYSGMGATLVAAVFHDNVVTAAHVGDSRLYRLRDGELKQLSRDHSLLQEQVDAGIITAEQARAMKNRNLLTRALGADPVVEAEIREHEAHPGDVFLLCSDGLTDMLADDRIAATIQEPEASLERCAARLVELANEAGGRDNVTVALVRVARTFPVRRTWWARLRAWFR